VPPETISRLEKEAWIPRNLLLRKLGGVGGLKHWKRISCITVLFFLAAGQAAFGAGFALYDFSVRGNALGGAMVGRADDPSALALNPAGITQIPGSAFMTSVGFLLPYGTIAYNSTGAATDQKDRTFILPSMYYTKQMNDRLWFGIGVMSRFGLGTEFPDDWFGRYNSYRAMIESVSVNPNIAWKVNDSLSLSIGVEALWFEADLRKKSIQRGVPPRTLPRMLASGSRETTSPLAGTWGSTTGWIRRRGSGSTTEAG